MRIYFFATLFFTSLPLHAKLAEEHGNFVHWTVSQEFRSKAQIQLVLQAKMEKGFHLYSLQTGEESPVATSVKLSATPGVQSAQIFESAPKEVKHPEIGLTTHIFEDQAHFPILLQLADAKTKTLDLEIKYSVCSDRRCYPPEHQVLHVKLDGKNGGRKIANFEKIYREQPLALSLEKGPHDV